MAKNELQIKDNEETRVAYTLDRTAQGASVRQIANELGVMPSTVRKYLSKISNAFIRRWPEMAAQIKGTQTLQIEEIIADLFQQYSRSKEINQDGMGDLDILKVLRQYMGDLRTIWGADEPLELDDSDNPYVVREELDANQLLDVIRGLKQVGALPAELDMQKLEAGLYIDAEYEVEEKPSEN